ncbi:MAG: molybdopterin-binding protein [Deltaproteobacteria bacterium]|nr:molybdopterin-binding protein [Deltaproteobacteria bacterium]MBW2052469.1 molybdopterin-binding protein [Deltaproteobacteria bacterium]MBW2141494.1 molybdopterin-binding protein [Deltaproteobacteria bacterium]MBW2323572.1 molybdopterin-binding protein [Deltaproteobacteria bacterium]
MKKIKVENAVGTVLAHDITRIVPGKFKGVGFKKGHVVTEEDVPGLLKLGKSSLYVLELSPDQLHEDQAALRIAPAISGDNLKWTDPVEGKSNIVSIKDGLLKVNTAGLLRINKLGNIIISTLRTNFPVKKGQTIAATRIIPLTISRRKIEKLENLSERFKPILQVRPYRRMRVGGVVTGSEIYKGLINDEFDRYVAQKFIDYGCEYVRKIVVPDNADAISRAILELKELGCELILATGGLSVDPDDVTRKGIRKAGARLISYGSPILPGAMFLYALLNEIPILGLPACVYYYKATVYDLILPRVLAGERITKNDIAKMGHGGLCLNCENCRYPVCPFGK